MNLRELEYLVAIDEERHFNRAAQRCFVSQPTLSGQLKKLEQQLGVQLVERNTRQVVMTDVGHAVAAQARRVLMEAKAVKEIAASFHDPLSGALQVGLIPTVAPYLLPVIMPTLREHFANLKLWLHEQQTKVLLEKLRHAELDMMIQALPIENHEFVEIDLYREPFWLLVHCDHELAQRSSITVDDLEGRDMLLLEEGHCLREHTLDVCFKAGAREDNQFHATSLETLRHMVGEGMGLSLLPELAVPKVLNQDENIRYIPFSGTVPIRRIGMLYRKESYRAKTFESLAEVIRQRMAEHFKEPLNRELG